MKVLSKYELDMMLKDNVKLARDHARMLARLQKNTADENLFGIVYTVAREDNNEITIEIHVDLEFEDGEITVGDQFETLEEAQLYADEMNQSRDHDAEFMNPKVISRDYVVMVSRTKRDRKSALLQQEINAKIPSDYGLLTNLIIPSWPVLPPSTTNHDCASRRMSIMSIQQDQDHLIVEFIRRHWSETVAVKQISDGMGIPRDVVIGSIKRLVAAGVVERCEIKWKNKTYTAYRLTAVKLPTKTVVKASCQRQRLQEVCNEVFGVHRKVP